MTLKEIHQFLLANQEKENLKLEHIYLQASLQANFVGFILNGKQIPPIQEIFPEIYNTVETEQSRQKREEMEIVLFENQMKAWAKAHNEWRAKQKKDGENN